MAETLTSSNPLAGAQGATATLTHDYAPSHDRGLPCSAGETLTVLRDRFRGEASVTSIPGVGTLGPVAMLTLRARSRSARGTM